MLLGCEEFRMEVLLGLKDVGIEWVEDKRRIAIGMLDILHGHEWFARGGVNPARTAFLRAKSCILVAHNHQKSEHAEPTLRGELISAWSQACLCELAPRYMPINKWCHGFATVEQYARGNFVLENKKILGGKVI